MEDKSMRFLEELCNSPGPSGFEKAPLRLIKEYVKEYADSVYWDRMGNLFFEKMGSSDSPVVLVPGHVDEIGFIITSINQQGYLTFNQLGGWFDQVLLGQRVSIMTKGGLVPGVIACKPPHVMDAEERKKVVTKDKMFIDVGACNREEVKAMGIRVGDAVVPDSKFYVIEKKAFKEGKEVGKRKLICGKAFDNRISAFLATELIKTLRKENIGHPNKVIGAATVQEEVGSRGAKTAAVQTKPDVAIILDVDISGDVPGIEPHQAPSRMGEGVSITVFDASMIPNQALKDLVIGICEEKNIPHQLSTMAGGGTDGASIHVANAGVPCIVIGVPTRHIHSHVAMIDTADLESTLRLSVELVKALDRGTVESLTQI
ncbi:MAG: M42 family metallopeptidase [Methanomassiliicoccales archaeon]